ncbi:YitT family protein [Paenibacillus sp. LMG 31459]|uniref:YitT family protein n=1 Tax=Paenibacillus phytohabitans TaxID=2654978 RepID=A0ABX1YDB9_9BACL|nr:YitT family protein [Paenibacillus phytohabitans]NOU78972.1 YitT family protein [Paenibacillus phytohabitans]
MEWARIRKSRLPAFFIFSCGILILTLGVSLTILSGLGASPFDALLVGLSRNVGLTVGSWEVLIAILLIGCNSWLTRQRPEILGLVTAFITGIGIDGWLFLLHHLIEPHLWVSKIAFYSLGLIAIGLGTSIYLYSKYAPIPVDRLTLVLQTVTGLNILFTRTLIYLIFLVAALIFKGPIGIGTLLTIGLGGFILNYFMPLTQKALDRHLTLRSE